MWYKAAGQKEILMTQRKYTPEFKKQALELAQELGSFAEAARRLGVRRGYLQLEEEVLSTFRFKCKNGAICHF